MIIHDIRQMVCWQLICTLEEYLIVEDICLHTYLTTDEVIHEHLLSTINLEAHHILVPFGNQSFYFLLRQCQRVTHLTASMAVVLEVLDLGTLRLQFLWGIEGDICLIGIQQLLHIFLIDITTLTLTVRTFVTTEAHALVELDAQPLERL